MEYLIKPWAHQLEAIERAKSLEGFALFFEMGAGKTGAAINILREKINQKQRFLRTLVFCPPIVIPNWKDEFLLHSKIKASQIHLLSGSGSKRLKLFEAKRDEPGIFVTNYESLLLGSTRVVEGAGLKKRTHLVPGPLFQAFKAWRPEAIIFDESHKLKSGQASRSKLADALGNPADSPAPFKWLLSGSPVLNSPLDLFQQFKIMDGGKTFGRNFFMFRARYFVDQNAGMPKDRYFPKWVIAPGALEAINKLIFQSGMRVTKAECMDLPEEVSVTIKCGMTGPQAKNYKEMKQDFVTFMGQSAASATLAIVKALRLMQITSGFLSLDGQGEEMDVVKVPYVKTPKDEALVELLEELTPTSKVIVWAVWKENYARIADACRLLGVEFVEVHGGISRTKQDENVARFKSDPKVRVFIGHPGSGGIGISLTCAPYSIFYSRTFSLEHWLQSRARNHRGGQRERVTHYDLVCEGTIDQLVQNKLANKFDMSEKLLRDISQEMKAQ